MQYTKYEIGKNYDFLKTKVSSPQIALADGLLTFYLPLESIHPKELYVLENNSFTLSFKTIQMLTFFTANFGVMHFEAPYNPYLNDPDFLEAYMPGQGMPFLLMVGEATTGELKHIRLSEMGHDFTNSLKSLIQNHKEQWASSYSLEKFNQLLEIYYQTVPYEKSIQLKGDNYIEYMLKV